MKDKLSQVREFLLDGIESGRFPPRSKLPGARDIAAEVGASFLLVQHAVSSLEQDGNIVAGASVPSILAALGLWLFLCCDVCVGLYQSWLLSGALDRAVHLGMWLFYLPGQVLLSLSALPDPVLRGFFHETK